MKRGSSLPEYVDYRGRRVHCRMLRRGRQLRHPNWCRPNCWKPEPPPPPPESVLESQPADVRAAIANYQRSGEAPILHDGITTRFPYEADAQFLVLCEPLRVTEILLAPGESVENAAAGDTERWMIQPVDGPRAGEAQGAWHRDQPHHPDRPPCLSPDAQVGRQIYATRRLLLPRGDYRRRGQPQGASSSSAPVILNPGAAGQTQLWLYRFRA